MKPLELTVYETDEETGRYMCANGVTYAAESVDEFASWNRLTDAELAAEYWAACTNCATIFPRPIHEWERAETILRFATSPHYCEAHT